MPVDPELIPPQLLHPAPLSGIPAEESYLFQKPGRPGSVPNLGHTVIFGLMIGAGGLLVGLFLTGFIEHLPLFRHESITLLQTDPRVVVPLEAVMYALAALLAWAIFPRLWHQPFLRALRWNGAAARRRLAALAGVGVIVSIVVQLLSNYLPIPKSLPIDKFFQNPVGVWIVALFGITVAPFFEELAFRGFLLPSLANAWEWVARGRHDRSGGPGYPPQSNLNSDALATYAALSDPFPPEAAPELAGKSDPPWSLAALIFASVGTSIGFALLHAEQLAHAWAPLGVLFTVSLVLCIVRLRMHSLAASAFVHACYNATIFLLLFIGTGGFRHLDKLNG